MDRWMNGWMINVWMMYGQMDNGWTINLWMEGQKLEVDEWIDGGWMDE